MEKGTLNIRKTKKGFAASISYEKRKGKQGRLPVSVVRFDNDDLDGKECEFERQGGTLVRLMVEGNEIYKAVRKQKRETQKSRPGGGNDLPDSFDLKAAIRPNDLLGIGVHSQEVDNFNLKYNKFARWNRNERRGRNPFSFFQARRGRNNGYEIKAYFGKFDFKGLADRSTEQAQQLLGSAHKVLDLEVDWRLISGLGTASVYETGMALHHIYGIPYLPASGIKGVLRSWVIQTAFGETAAPPEEREEPLVNAEYRALMNESFCSVFGCPATARKVEFDREGKTKKDAKGNYRTQTHEVAAKDQDKKGQALQGALMVWDAFPLNTPSLKVDVMNPHFGKYYGKGEPPVDYDQPIPIPFLTVESTRFRFIFGFKEGAFEDWKIDGKTIDLWLKDALENHGLGAKTAIGYGYFESSKAQ